MSQTSQQDEKGGPPPSVQLSQMLFGFMVSQSISVAAKLGIADLLKNGPRAVEDLAQATSTHSGALYRLLRALASVGIFSQDEAGRFGLTPLADPLRGDAENSLRDWAIYLGADFHQQVWANLEYSVRTGLPASEKLWGKEAFAWLTENPEQGRIFNNAMTSMSHSVSREIVAAYDFTRFARVCDVGGGHGFFLATLLKSSPRLKGLLFDLPSVMAGAAELLGKEGVAERCQAIGGDFFQAVPGGCDAIVMKHIIHDWDDEASVRLLRNCHRALDEHGTVLVIEMVLPEGNQPSVGKLVDIEMLLHLRSHERTLAQYQALFERAGFEVKGVVPTRSPYSIIEGRRV